MPTKSELEMLKLLASYCYLTPSQLSHLTARTPHAVRRNLRQMDADGFARFVPPLSDRFGENVWFLTQKGWDKCRDMGWIEKKVQATDEKSNKTIPHDLVLTTLHIKLFDLYGDDLYWTQLHQDCYRRWGKKENERINADAFFSIPADGAFASFFVEVENTGESKYEDGKSSRVRKMEAYADYAKGHFQQDFDGDDFRVMTLLPTADAVTRSLGKLVEHGGDVATRRFWSSDYASIETLTKESQAFTTPKDIEWRSEKRRYNAQRLYSLGEA